MTRTRPHQTSCPRRQPARAV